VVGDNWQLSVPQDFVREEVSPVLEAGSTTVGAGACCALGASHARMQR
jgi:hypothetical protein